MSELSSKDHLPSNHNAASHHKNIAAFFHLPSAAFQAIFLASGFRVIVYHHAFASCHTPQRACRHAHTFAINCHAAKVVFITDVTFHLTFGETHQSFIYHSANQLNPCVFHVSNQLGSQIVTDHIFFLIYLAASEASKGPFLSFMRFSIAPISLHQNLYSEAIVETKALAMIASSVLGFGNLR